MSAEEKTWVSRGFFWLGLAAAVCAIAWLWPRADYYLLSRGQRPLHLHHEFLRPSGRGGLSFGVVGTVLIFLNLSYLIRRQLLQFEWLGSLHNWMSFHVFTGLLGPLLIFIHSTFILRSALASIACLALMVVVVTGLLGRYIYAHTPRSVQGKELELSDIRRSLTAYREHLKKLGMPMEIFDKTLTPSAPSSSGLIGEVGALFHDSRINAENYAKLHEIVMAAPELRPAAKDILELGRKYFQESQWVARYHELRSLMSSWRFFHRWFAIVMLILAACHILVAVTHGNIDLRALRPLGQTP
jgi:hypothetical protein